MPKIDKNKTTELKIDNNTTMHLVALTVEEIEIINAHRTKTLIVDDIRDLIFKNV